MIYLQLKTNAGALYSSSFAGTYSNAVDYYLGKKLANKNEIITEVFETSRPDYEDNYNANR